MQAGRRAIQVGAAVAMEKMLGHTPFLASVASSNAGLVNNRLLTRNADKPRPRLLRHRILKIKLKEAQSGLRKQKPFLIARIFN